MQHTHQLLGGQGLGKHKRVKKVFAFIKMSAGGGLYADWACLNP